MVTLFSLSVSIRTVRCNGWESCHRSYYPEHILAYGSGKTRSFRVLVSSSFRVDCMEAEIGWRSKDHTESGTQVVVAWSPSLGRGPGNLGRNGRGWSLLVRIFMTQARRVFFGVPSWGYWFANRRRCGTTWLMSGIVVRSER